MISTMPYGSNMLQIVVLVTEAWDGFCKRQLEAIEIIRVENPNASNKSVLELIKQVKTKNIMSTTVPQIH